MFHNDNIFGSKKPPSSKPKYDWVLIPLLVILVSVIASIPASTGNIKLVALAVCAVIGAVIFFYRELLLWSVIALGLVGAGLARLYTPSLQQIRWLAIPIIIGLLLYVVTDHLLARRNVKKTQTSPIVLWSILFMIFTIVSAVINQTDLKSMAIGLKGYFQVWDCCSQLAISTGPKRPLHYYQKYF